MNEAEGVFGADILEGVLVGLFFTAIVGILTFVAHHHLPYKKMLIFTGIMLEVVLLIIKSTGQHFRAQGRLRKNRCFSTHA